MRVFETESQLKQVHPLHAKMSARWNRWATAYEGDNEFIVQAIFRNERESFYNYKQRLDEAYDFNYVESIVDLFNFYLVEKAVNRHMPGIENDKQWKLFVDDCDTNSTNYDDFLTDSQKIASVYGAVGILVTKANVGYQSVADEIANGVYPYICAYTLPNVLDWEFGRDPKSGRQRLEFLKLKNDDDTYLVWELDQWRLYKLANKNVAELIDSGPNPLGEIPFLWMNNIKDIKNSIIGKSDVKNIVPIVESIVRNFSCGDEVIKYAGFPIYQKPMEDETEDGTDEVVHSIKGVDEFNPEHGKDGKSSWLETVILEPIEAILKWTDRKTDEIYRIMHLSGVHGQRKSNNEVSSGLALRYEFQQLTSVLSKKSVCLTEADLKIIYFWLRWQKRDSLFENVEVHRSKNFSVDDLAASLENTIESMNVVISNKFKAIVQKKIVRQEMPDLSDKEYADIDAEIDKNVSDNNQPKDEMNHDAGL